MRPSCVMTKDQKMDRFKKRLEQKQDEASMKAAQRQETSINKNVQQRRRSLTDAQKEKFYPNKVFKKVSRVEDKLELLKQQRINFHRNLWFQAPNRQQRSPDEILRIQPRLPIRNLNSKKSGNPGEHEQHFHQNCEQLFPRSYSEFVQQYKSLSNATPRDRHPCDPRLNYLEGKTVQTQNWFQSVKTAQSVQKQLKKPTNVLAPAKFNPEFCRKQPYLPNQNGILKNHFQNNNFNPFDSSLVAKLATNPFVGPIQQSILVNLTEQKQITPIQQSYPVSETQNTKDIFLSIHSKPWNQTQAPNENYKRFPIGEIKQQKVEHVFKQPMGPELHLKSLEELKTKNKVRNPRLIQLNLRKTEHPPSVVPKRLINIEEHKSRYMKRKIAVKIEPPRSKCRKVEHDSSQNFDLWPSFMLSTVNAIVFSFRQAFEGDVSSLTPMNVIQRLSKLQKQFKEFALQQR